MKHKKHKTEIKNQKLQKHQSENLKAKCSYAWVSSIGDTSKPQSAKNAMIRSTS